MTQKIRPVMDGIPFELKQRICSFLSPNELKPLRLTCTSFSKAAEPYLINRFILFNHPDSFATLHNIINHEAFSKYLTSIIYDTSLLVDFPSFHLWKSALTPEQTDQFNYPHWKGYVPKSISLSTDGDYATVTMQAMRNARTTYLTAWKYVESTQKAFWNLHQELVRFQSSSAFQNDVKNIFQRAFGKCPRLKNFVASSCHPSKVEKARRNVFNILQSRASWIRHEPDCFAAFQNIFPNLDTLTLIDIESPRYVLLEESQTLRNLKHLRLLPDTGYDIASNISNMHTILRNAVSLETLIISTWYEDITELVRATRSDRLRVCLLEFASVAEDVLVDFILRHKSSLKRLALGSGRIVEGDWQSLLRRISCQLPLLKRIQLEGMCSSPDDRRIFSSESESAAERFVLFGGPSPRDEHDWSPRHEPYRELRGVNRGTMVGNELLNECPAGLWQDYEDMTNGTWHLVITED